MVLRQRREQMGLDDRRGAIVPMIAVSMVALLGFVAMAVDVGMIAVARTQCQNAADAAAMAGARTLNGDSANSYNIANVQPNALAAAQANAIAGQTIQSNQLVTATGSYNYNYSTARFEQAIPAGSFDTTNLVQATVTSNGTNTFGRFIGVGSFATSGIATAVHRPRDVAVVVDMSGSMRFDSLLGIPYSGTRTQSNNPETVYPTFGAYSAPVTPLRNATGPTYLGSYSYGLANVTTDTVGGSTIVEDFYQNALGGTPVAAFSAAPDSYATTPGGDKPLRKFGSTTIYAKTVQEITNGATFTGYTQPPFTGYSGPTVSEFVGYTQGPRYWGKTFFIWPPDPRSGKDWRTKFFYNYGTTTGVTDNTKLWGSSGDWLAPASGTYSINYSAILAWIKASPCPFPNQLRAGRILYYDAIPSSINTSSFPPSNLNERFWKRYIDYVLGVFEYSSGRYMLITPKTGYGDDFDWGTGSITTKPSGKYMTYTDNPERPYLHFWFGPMTFVDFLGNYNLYGSYDWTFWLPGTCHDGPCWACKLGVQAAMTDIENNHPNDFVSLVFFNRPKYSSSDDGTFNRPRVPLGRNYQRLQDVLWFPISTIDSPGTEIRMFDTANEEVPRASNGTTTGMGLMLAYNQLSSSSTLRSYAPSPAPYGEAGGLGRKGAQRLVILETDGMANTLAAASVTNNGAYNSYYNIRTPGEYPSETGSDVTTQVLDVARQICALDTASPPGYATTRKPVLIHCLAEGPIFDDSSTDPQKSTALSLLQNIQYIGNTQGSATEPLASYKIITGPSADRIDKIRQAFSSIMQDGIQVSLIR